jgi:hypothetical protein
MEDWCGETNNGAHVRLFIEYIQQGSNGFDSSTVVFYVVHFSSVCDRLPKIRRYSTDFLLLL